MWTQNFGKVPNLIWGVIDVLIGTHGMASLAEPRDSLGVVCGYENQRRSARG